MGKKRIGRKKAVPAEPEVGALFDCVVAIMDGARDRVVRQVNHEMLIAYWHIGREIVERVQEGEGRAAYGREVLRALSKRLADRYGKGFSVTSLRSFRRFYKVNAVRRPEIEVLPGGGSDGCDEPDDPSEMDDFLPNRHKSSEGLGIGGQDPIQHALRAELGEADLKRMGHALRDPFGNAYDTRQSNEESGVSGELPELGTTLSGPFRGFAPRLSWTHYRTLTMVANRVERQFYEIEANAQGWSARQLERQIHSLLFARLLKSRDKVGVMELSTKGQVIEHPMDALKDPYVLDFLDLPDCEPLHESDLEAAILHKLRAFLLELGKGFAFVARQRRLSFEDEHFYVDLVFYNITLKCYLLIDLKVGKLTHQDIGQMDSYVRLFDDQCTSEDDNPTIGLILCAQRNEAIARYSVLRESQQLFAARYVQVLPSVEELERELQRERRRLEERHGR